MTCFFGGRFYHVPDFHSAYMMFGIQCTIGLRTGGTNGSVLTGCRATGMLSLFSGSFAAGALLPMPVGITLPCVTGEIMTEGSDFFVAGVIATRTGIVSIPALFCTGRSLGFMRNLVMTECSDLFVGRIIAVGASKISVPTDFRAGRSLCIVFGKIMTKCI